jgi:hypothetical protein
MSKNGKIALFFLSGIIGSGRDRMNILYAELDGPQIGSTNRKSANLRTFLDLRTYRKCGSLRICCGLHLFSFLQN